MDDGGVRKRATNRADGGPAGLQGRSVRLAGRVFEFVHWNCIYTFLHKKIVDKSIKHYEVLQRVKSTLEQLARI